MLRRTALVPVALVVTVAGSALAQGAAGAQSTLLDPSIRASGMGRASGAVFWGDVNDWANPALLGYRDGVTYEYGRTRLLPDLVNDLYFTTNRIHVGAWGMAVTTSGFPIDGFGGNHLDYGETFAVGDDEVEVGTFHSYEDVDALGIGVNAVRLIDHAWQTISGQPSAWSRFGDVAFGYTHKDVYVNLAPAWATEDGRAGEAESSNSDTGWMARVSPMAIVRGLVPSFDESLTGAFTHLDIDVAYGESTMNREDEFISFLDTGQSSPFGRWDRESWAARIAIGMPRALAGPLRDDGRAWLAEALDPVLEFGYVEDEVDQYVYDDDGAPRGASRVEGDGFELTFFNVFSYRWGRIDDPDGTIVDDTSGWGIQLPLGGFARVRYDRATVPQSEFLEEDVTRSGVTVHVDARRLAARLR